MPQVLHLRPERRASVPSEGRGSARLNALRGALKRHATRDELFKGDFATTILVHDPEL